MSNRTWSLVAERYRPNRVSAGFPDDRPYYRGSSSEADSVSQLYDRLTTPDKSDAWERRVGWPDSAVFNRYFSHNRTSSDSESVSLPLVELPDASIGAAMHTRRSAREFTDELISRRDVSTLLWTAAGTSGTRETVTSSEISLRPYPSAGALYPCEIYVIPLASEDLDTSTYRYEAPEHELVHINDTEVNDFANAFKTRTMNPDDAALAIVLAGDSGRIESKYGPAGHRFMLLECGHIAQNLLLVATVLNLQCLSTGAFNPDMLKSGLGIDDPRLHVHYALLFGGSASNTEER